MRFFILFLSAFVFGCSGLPNNVKPSKYSQFFSHNEAEKIVVDIVGVDNPSIVSLHPQYVTDYYLKLTGWGVTSNACKGSKIEPGKRVQKIEILTGNRILISEEGYHSSGNSCKKSYKEKYKRYGRYNDKYLFIYGNDVKKERWRGSITECEIKNYGFSFECKRHYVRNRITGEVEAKSSLTNGQEKYVDRFYYTTYAQANDSPENDSVLARDPINSHENSNTDSWESVLSATKIVTDGIIHRSNQTIQNDRHLYNQNIERSEKLREQQESNRATDRYNQQQAAIEREKERNQLDNWYAESQKRYQNSVTSAYSGSSKPNTDKIYVKKSNNTYSSINNQASWDDNEYSACNQYCRGISTTRQDHNFGEAVAACSKGCDVALLYSSVYNDDSLNCKRASGDRAEDCSERVDGRYIGYCYQAIDIWKSKKGCNENENGLDGSL